MLIKLTNTCTMGCEHCMEMSVPDSGENMSFSAFRAAVEFGVALGTGVYVFSGGEPTEHPNFRKFCEWFEKRFRGTSTIFTICSNGMWLKDFDKTEDVRKVLELTTCMGMQVYTNKKWYREYSFVVRNKSAYESISPKVYLTIDAPIYMKDLGRAKTSDRAQREVLHDTHFMSCLNCSLLVRQLPMGEFGVTAGLSGKYCTPSVDAMGDVHMSESRTCPRVGSVLKELPAAIYDKMKQFKPCGNCAEYRRFMHNDTPQSTTAKTILGL